MVDLLLLPISFSIVLMFYKYLEKRKTKYLTSSDCSRSIVNLTSTNNNYDSFNNVLDELDSDEAQTILGKPLYVNMRGYM